mmetsp:Transcript_36114/g.84372  ORF Transcript_36114/g.84372 Transcript_36114/m.84372 type:complete len:107 (+) Transcript_36114:1661-1981(+)
MQCIHEALSAESFFHQLIHTRDQQLLLPKKFVMVKTTCSVFSFFSLSLSFSFKSKSVSRIKEDFQNRNGIKTLLLILIKIHQFKEELPHEIVNMALELPFTCGIVL